MDEAVVVFTRCLTDHATAAYPLAGRHGRFVEKRVAGAEPSPMVDRDGQVACHGAGERHPSMSRGADRLGLAVLEVDPPMTRVATGRLVDPQHLGVHRWRETHARGARGRLGRGRRNGQHAEHGGQQEEAAHHHSDPRSLDDCIDERRHGEPPRSACTR